MNEIDFLFMIIKLRKNVYKFFNDINDFIQWLTLFSRKRKSIIYFHNLMFDAKFFLLQLRTIFDKVNIIETGGKLLSIKCMRQREKMRKGKKVIEYETIVEFKDTYALLVTKLENLGKFIGLKKGNTIKANENIYDNINYCIRDVDITEKSLKLLIQELEESFSLSLELKKIPLTIASLSKRLLNLTLQRKNNFTKLREVYDKYYIISRLQFLRKFYFGGRVEVFDLNEQEHVFYNDYNSAYPYVMRNYKYPLPPYNFLYNPSEKLIQKYQKTNQIALYIVELEETNEIPFYPTKNMDGATFYTIGQKKACLTPYEYDVIKEKYSDTIKILKIKEIISCSKFEDIFSEFIDTVYGLKTQNKNKNKFKYHVYKIILNSSYGKFGEKSEKSKLNIINYDKYIEKNGLNTYAQLLNESDVLMDLKENKLISTKENVQLNSNLIYAIYITNLVRFKLWTDIQKTKKPIYCDTDSIVTSNAIGYSNTLGAMDVEAEYWGFQALNPKEYYALKEENREKVMKCKGFSLKNKEKTYETIVQIYAEQIEIHRIVGLRESFRRHIPLNTALKQSKQKHHYYDKRYINEDLTTRPLDIEIINDKIKLKQLQEHNAEIIKSKILIPIFEKYANEQQKKFFFLNNLYKNDYIFNTRKVRNYKYYEVQCPVCHEKINFSEIMFYLDSLPENQYNDEEEELYPESQKIIDFINGNICTHLYKVEENKHGLYVAKFKRHKSEAVIEKEQSTLAQRLAASRMRYIKEQKQKEKNLLQEV